MAKLAGCSVIAALLFGVGVISAPERRADDGRQFWELQGAAPGARETSLIAAMRAEARLAREGTVVAAAEVAEME
jgi:hypothetical protein